MGILWSLAFLGWLSIEDLSANSAVWLAASLSAWAALRWALAREGQTPTVHVLGIGAFAGGAVVLIALALMALKNGLHAHTTPEYSYLQIVSVLRQGVWWVLGGVAVSGGWALLRDAHIERSQK